MFVVRLVVAIVVLAVLVVGALYALGALVEPEQREIHVTIPLPKPKN